MLYRERILQIDQGDILRREGWIASDLHVHSTCSCDVLNFPEFHPEAIYQKAIKKGLGYVTITDHDTMDAYDIIGWERERLVTGVEVSICDSLRVGHTVHINVYNLDRHQFKEIMMIANVARNIYTLIEFLKDQYLPFVYNHPFWFAVNDTPNYKSVEKLITRFPVVEYNMKRIDRKNLLTVYLAAKYKKGLLATTDTHIGTLGTAYTLSTGDTFTEYFQNIVDGNSYIVPQDLTVQNLNHEILAWIRLIFSLCDNQELTARYTGVLPIDNAIHFLANTKPSRYPVAMPFVERVLNHVAKTGVVSMLYLFFQQQTANRIARLLKLQATDIAALYLDEMKEGPQV